jgi:lipopolysaccharide export system permease protein
MKTLHTYLTREILVTLVMTVAVFTFVLLLGKMLKEILMLLVNHRIGFFIVAEAILLMIPFVLMFALPMGMLTATLLVFGRFSAEQELTAARASGLSLLSLTAPILGLSLVLCGVSALLNMQLAPQCHAAYRQLLFRAGIKQPNMYLPEGQYVTDFPGCIFYMGKNDGKTLRDVLVYMLEDGTNIFMKIHAPRGEFEVDEVTRQVTVRLFEARCVSVAEGRWVAQYYGEWVHQLDTSRINLAGKRVRINNMTFGQLQDELDKLEERIASSALFQPAPDGKTRVAKKTREELTLPVRVQMNRQLAFSFACFGFTLIGIPLGIRVHRRETNVGFAIALGLVMVYYCFLIAGGALSTRPEFWPHLIVWLPNVIFQGVGAVLLWRANRGM